MNNILVLNKEFDLVAVIDYYKSLIWTERYNEAGDFEVYLLGDTTAIASIQLGYYLEVIGSPVTMMVEQLEVTTDVEEGNAFVITGRSVESILDRRIIWPQTNLSGNLQNGIKKLINEAIISPTDTTRQIPNFVFEDSTDPAITALTFEAQYTGDNLYEVIVDICSAYNLGFSIRVNDLKQFVFKLYFGVDRSYNQDVNEYVVFSSKFGNLISSNYLETKKAYKSICVVAGEGEGSERKFAWINSPSAKPEDLNGLEKRELFVDARDISSTVYDDQTGDSKTIPDAEYTNLLIERGREKLSETKETKTFEGEVENGQTFTYGTHYFMGDIVQIVNEYDLKGTSRVTEFVRSISPSGIETYPTFMAINE